LVKTEVEESQLLFNLSHFKAKKQVGQGNLFLINVVVATLHGIQ